MNRSKSAFCFFNLIKLSRLIVIVYSECMKQKFHFDGVMFKYDDSRILSAQHNAGALENMGSWLLS